MAEFVHSGAPATRAHTTLATIRMTAPITADQLRRRFCSGEIMSEPYAGAPLRIAVRTSSLDEHVDEPRLGLLSGGRVTMRGWIEY